MPVRLGRSRLLRVARRLFKRSARHTTREPFSYPLQRFEVSLPMLRSRLASPFGVACAAAIVLGCVIRARPVMVADFPLNDGGLFYLMTDELRGAGYRLPAFTEYNAARIPFAYPPFGFYAAAALADVTSLDLVQVVRLLPLVTT